MKNRVKYFISRYKITCIIALVIIAIHPFIIIFNIDIFEHIIIFLESVDKYELDEILVLSLFLLIGFIIDVQRGKLKQQRELFTRRQRIRSLKNTMTTVHDIVNNSLNEIKGFDMNCNRNPNTKKKLADNTKPKEKLNKTK